MFRPRDGGVFLDHRAVEFELGRAAVGASDSLAGQPPLILSSSRSLEMVTCAGSGCVAGAELHEAPRITAQSRNKVFSCLGLVLALLG